MENKIIIPDPAKTWYKGRLRDIGTNIINQAIKEKSIKRKDIAEALNVCYVTACTLIRNPDKLTRGQLRILIRILDIDDESLLRLVKGE